MECKSCGKNKFFVHDIPCCDECNMNGAWHDSEYTMGEKIIDEKQLVRSQVENEGECYIGTAYGAGCHMYICTYCGSRTHWPAMEEC